MVEENNEILDILSVLDVKSMKRSELNSYDTQIESRIRDIESQLSKSLHSADGSRRRKRSKKSSYRQSSPNVSLADMGPLSDEEENIQLCRAQSKKERPLSARVSSKTKDSSSPNSSNTSTSSTPSYLLGDLPEIKEIDDSFQECDSFAMVKWAQF